MKIGIISDTHENLPAVRAAVALFNDHSVEAVLHCGDFISPASILPFKELTCQKFIAVFGNNDGEVEGLSKVASDNGWVIEHGTYQFELGGRRIAMMHIPSELDKMISERKFDLIAFGHQHEVVIEKKNGTLLLNPGEAGGWITGKSTVMTLDLETLEPELHYPT